MKILQIVSTVLVIWKDLLLTAMNVHTVRFAPALRIPTMLVPSDILEGDTQCSRADYGHASTDSCISDTQWSSSYIECRNGDPQVTLPVIGSCADESPDRPKCLDCGPVGICAEAMATCNSLGLAGDDDDTSSAEYEILYGVVAVSLASLTGLL